MTSPKLVGLAYLCSEFRELTVPTTFVYGLDDLPALDTLGAQSPVGGRGVLRVRTGRTSGSEMEAPYASFENVADAVAFLREHMEADEHVVAVVHPVDHSYFEAQVVGSLLVGDDGSLYIELQSLAQADLDELHAGTGARPRDWAVDTVLHVGVGETVSGVPARHLPLLEDLEALVEIGRRVHADHPGTDAVVRFNLYAHDLLILDDLRCVGAFVGAER